LSLLEPQMSLIDLVYEILGLPRFGV